MTNLQNDPAYQLMHDSLLRMDLPSINGRIMCVVSGGNITATRRLFKRCLPRPLVDKNAPLTPWQEQVVLAALNAARTLKTGTMYIEITAGVPEIEFDLEEHQNAEPIRDNNVVKLRRTA